jgi:hypothetical protein
MAKNGRTKKKKNKVLMAENGRTGMRGSCSRSSRFLLRKSQESGRGKVGGRRDFGMINWKKKFWKGLGLNMNNCE